MPPPTAADPWLKSRQFGIVIDAGSSGSRLQIYSWKDAESVRLQSPGSLHTLPAVEKGTKAPDDWQIKAEPGISTFGPKPEGVAKYLEPLLAHAQDQIPPSLHSQTPVFLLATAGMRLLPEDQQNSVLSAACDYIYMHTKFKLDGRQGQNGSGFNAGTGIERCGRSIRIISGEEEGLFGWIAVNYLMNGFAVTHKDHDRPTTFGFLDMGGASTQIAFEPIIEPDGTVRTEDENLVDVTLRLLNGEEIHHKVFVTTWLGFGTNQARQRYVKQEVSRWEERHHKGHPTLSHSSTDTNVATDGLHQRDHDRRSLSTDSYHHAKHSTSITSSINIQDPCLPKHLILHTSHHDPHADAFSEITPVTLEGTGNFAQCLAQTSPLLNKTAPCERSPCLFNGVHVPPIDFKHHRFIGISEYWYSSQHVFGLGGAFDFEKYEKAAEEFCGADWKDLLKKHLKGAIPEASPTWGKDVEVSRLEMQCFKAAWIVNVLGKGVGIPRTSKAWEQIDVEGTKDPKVDEKKAKQLGLDEGGVPNSIFQSVDTIHGTAVSWTLGKMVLEASKGIPSSSKSPKPIPDPMGPKPNIEKPGSKSPFGFGWDALEGKLPSLRGGSLGLSPMLFMMYVVILAVVIGIAFRFRTRIRTSFRRWRRSSMKREKDAFVDEDGVPLVNGNGGDISRPGTPAPASSFHATFNSPFNFLYRLTSTVRQFVPTSSPRRLGLASQAPSLYATPSTPVRPQPRYSHSLPMPASPSPYGSLSLSQQQQLTGNGGLKYPSSMVSVTEDPDGGQTIVTNGLNPNGLTVLSLSRNSSQVNLTRTLPTPRNVSSFSLNALATPGPTSSGFRTPTTFDHDEM
ncbi:Golgi apyrase [Tulasnella sp. 403]|nr:Golgi apyrase [Tulasnella sp. 403]